MRLGWCYGMVWFGVVWFGMVWFGMVENSRINDFTLGVGTLAIEHWCRVWLITTTW